MLSYSCFNKPTKVGSNSYIHTLFKQYAFIALLMPLIFIDQHSFVASVAVDELQSTAILQLLQLQVGLESAASEPNPSPTQNNTIDTLSTTLQRSTAETTDEMLLSTPIAYTQPKQRSADNLARSINTQQPLNISQIPLQLQDSIENLVAYPKDKTDTSVVAADVVNAVMGLVNGVMQNSPPKYQNDGYDGSEIDLLAMMAIGDLQAVLKAVQGWALEGQYGKTAGFVQVALEKKLIDELTEVLTFVFENWSINIESLALQVLAIMQSGEKEQVFQVVISGMRQAKDVENIVEVFKYAFVEAQQPVGLAFAELAARSAEKEVCQLGGILDKVTFGLSPKKFQKVIDFLEQVNGDVCIISFVQTLDVARGITSKSSVLESSGQECVEVPPPGGYTCAQQLQFDKCGRYWMVQGGYCQVTCGTCGANACVDVQPTTQFTCPEQKIFGKCQADWMVQGGYCNYTCDRCPASSYLSPPQAVEPVILLSPIPLPTILQPPSPSDLLLPVMTEQLQQGECGALYNQTVDIIAVMLNEVVSRITSSLQT